MSLVGITGFIGSGKNLVGKYFVSKAGYTQDSFAASLKDACSVVFNWDRDMLEGRTDESRAWREVKDEWWAEKLGIENFSPRLALQLVGTNALREHFNPDLWLLTFERRYEDAKGEQDVIVTDARFPNEINLIRSLGGKIINVKRHENPVWYNVALKATQGDEDALNRMQSTYSYIHQSEWAWVGMEPDYIIINDGTIDKLEREMWDIHLRIAGVI